MEPILYLALFGPLLDASVKAANVQENAFNWFIPGLLSQPAVFGAAFVGFGLIAELRCGVPDRMRIAPMSRIAMLFGRSLRHVVIMVVQATLIMVVAIPFGLRIDLAGALVTIALLVLIGLALAPLSYTAALVLKSEDALAPAVNAVAVLVLFLSGILLPLALAAACFKFAPALSPPTFLVAAAV